MSDVEKLKWLCFFQEQKIKDLKITVKELQQRLWMHQGALREAEQTLQHMKDGPNLGTYARGDNCDVLKNSLPEFNLPLENP